MARSVRWKVRFKTLKEHDAEILIYEEGWTGGVTELEPAENTITTDEDNSDEMMKPVRTWTGYLRVVDNGDLAGLMPIDNQQHYLELLIDNVMKWCGYMQADTFSEEWDVTPLVVEFPLISPIGVLSSIYLDQTKDMGLVTMAALIVECIDATKVDYEKVYFPREVTMSAEDADYLIPLMLRISRYNFFSENKSVNRDDPEYQRYDADTCLSFLEEYCKFWGWSLHERGKSIYLISTVDVEYISISVEQLRKMASGGTSSISALDVSGNYDSANRVDIADIELAGDGHKRDMLQGYKKFVISAKINGVGAVVPSADFDDMDLAFTETYTHTMMGGSSKYYERIMAYVPQSEYVETNIYQVEDTSNPSSPWEKVEYTSWNVSQSVGATFVKRDSYQTKDLEKKKNYNYRDCLMISLQQGLTGRIPTTEQAKELIILRMRSSGIAKYSEGAFVISASTSDIERHTFEEIAGNGKGTMEIMFRVGDKYWNGTAWGTDATWFIVNMGNDEGTDEGVGQIISTKTLSMPYNGADGYVMPINEELAGMVELTIHAVLNDGKYNILYLSDLKVEYYKDDTVVEQDRDENKYSGQVDVSYAEDMNTELSIASNNKNKAAYSLLSYPNKEIGELYFVSKGMMRPELSLLSNQKRIYGRITEKLNLEVERSEIFSPMLKLTRGKSNYKLLAESIDWADDTEEIMIEDIRNEA